MGIESFFGAQADRLLRKEWGDDVDSFAQELVAMFTSKEPINLTGPVTIDRGNADNVPALTINDGTNGSSAPIVINRTDGTGSSQPNVDSGGGYSCCGSSSQNAPPKMPPVDQGKFPPVPPVTPAGPPGGLPDPNMPRREFSGTILIKVVQGEPDVFGWNGQQVPFIATGCVPYKPPSVNGPTSAFDPSLNQPEPVTAQLAAFMAKWSLDGYDLIADTVAGPGSPCA
jgi:hypothetical protein